MDGEDAEPIEQIETKAAGGDGGLHVRVRRRQHAHIGADRLVATETLERLLLQDAQQLALGQRACGADLVEEQRAAVALLELADTTAVGPGESTLFVAEQLAFQKLLWDGGAVNRQERPTGPATVLIEGVRDQFLAGAALAGNEDRHVLRGDAANRLVHFLHGRTDTDNGIGAIVHLVPGGEQGGNVHEPADGQGTLDHLTQRAQLQRFEKVLVSAELHGLDGRVGGAAAGDEDDGTARVQFTKSAQHVQAGHIGQMHVKNDDIGLSLPGDVQTLRGGLGREDRHVRLAEGLAKGEQDRGFIIDYEQRGHGTVPKINYPRSRGEHGEKTKKRS